MGVADDAVVEVIADWGRPVTFVVRRHFMRIGKPRFTLNDLCPFCQQRSSLLFLTCPTCGKVIIACDEDGTVYPNPPDLDDHASTTCDPWISTTTLCPECRGVHEFRYSTGEEIQQLGIAKEDYS